MCQVNSKLVGNLNGNRKRFKQSLETYLLASGLETKVSTDE